MVNVHYADRDLSTRLTAIENAKALLQENIEDSTWWPPYSDFTQNEARKEKEQILFHHWHPVFVEFHASLSGTLFEIEKNDVHKILLYGASRRLRSMHKALNDICEIAYLGRTKVASKDEKTRLDDALLLFYVHLMGVIDALAIAFHRICIEPEVMPEKRADLLERNFRRKASIQDLNILFQENAEWFKRVKFELRNRYVHKVPPYVPPSELSEADQEQYKKLENKLSIAIHERRFEGLEEIRDEQAALGVFCSDICFIEDNASMPLLITVLDDAMRFQVITLTIFNELALRLEFIEN